LPKAPGAAATQNNWLIIGASSLGTVFEWYDFYLYGLLASVISSQFYFPLFGALTRYANPALSAALSSAPVTVVSDPKECSFQFDPVGKNAFDTTSCDIAKAFLAKAGVSDPKVVKGADRKAAIAAFQKQEATINKPMVVLILFILVLCVTMVYGPIAALLVELFPARIRYSSMSLPYHIGNGWFGGFLPTTAFAMVAATGDIYYGLWYPIVVAGLTLVVGLLFLPETFKRSIQ